MIQLDRTQYLSSEELRQRQLGQLAKILHHAYETVPFHRRRIEDASLSGTSHLSRDDWRRLAPVTRRDLQTAGTALWSSAPPEEHGEQTMLTTSGSTAQPVRMRQTDLIQMVWKACTMRDHLWHCRDFSQTLASIRFNDSPAAGPPFGIRRTDWGAATRGLVATGDAYLLGIQATISEQADWLRRIDPGYVMGYPSAMRALAEYFIEKGYRLSNLRHVRTFGEIVEPECRLACAAAWNVPVVDAYSAQEVGYIALQCPVHDHYHVQAESLYVEILDDSGNECQPGEVGRVVISTLHNFAMPLLRYEIGDFAEVGSDCDCGRGLPVIKRILGRQRNMLVLPNGERRWPAFGHGKQPENLPPFYQCQLVQRNLQTIEVKIVRPYPLSPTEERTIIKYVQETLMYPFDVFFSYVDNIPRSASGKFEDFLSEVI